MPLRTTRDLDAFLARPRGAAFVGEGFVYAYPTKDLFVVSLFGRPSAESARPLIRALPLELEPRVPPHVSIVDARRVEAVDGAAFTALAGYVKKQREGLSNKVTRVALLRPEGLSGAVVAGFFSVVDPPYPVLVATSLAEAQRFLAPHAPASVLREVENVVAAVADRPAIVVQTEDALRDAAFAGDLASVARALAMSARTLQRRLADAGTSFVDVARALRLREAERRLRETNDAVTTIALDCGWSSAQHFAADFRAAHGVTPTTWRSKAS